MAAKKKSSRSFSVFSAKVIIPLISIVGVSLLALYSYSLHQTGDNVLGTSSLSMSSVKTSKSSKPTCQVTASSTIASSSTKAQTVSVKYMLYKNGILTKIVNGSRKVSAGNPYYASVGFAGQKNGKYSVKIAITSPVSISKQGGTVTVSGCK